MVLLLGSCCSAPTAWAQSCEIAQDTRSILMDFGSYQPLTFAGKLTSANKNSIATLSVICSGEVSYTLSLGEIGGSILPRQMTNSTRPGAPPMNFNLFVDAQRLMVWGDGFTGQLLSGSTGMNNHTLYGQIPAGQNTLQPGRYNGGPGTITMTYSP